MEIEKDNTIPFLDTRVSRDSNGLLTTTVYRKPTHTDQYLAYNSHHPQSVKRGIVKCLYDRAKHLTSKPSAISKEKKHLSSVLVSNGYPSSFVRKLTKTTRPTANKELTQEFKSTAVLPYIKGVSEVLPSCLQQQSVRTVFKSDTTLRPHLVRPKDTLEPTKQDGVVYKKKFHANAAKYTSHRKSESVMVTPKKCKFLQLCEHQLSVKVTPTWCTFTPQ